MCSICLIALQQPGLETTECGSVECDSDVVVLSVTIDAGNCRESTYLLLTFCVDPSHLFQPFVTFDIWHFPLGQSLCYVLGSSGRVGLWGSRWSFRHKVLILLWLQLPLEGLELFKNSALYGTVCITIFQHIQFPGSETGSTVGHNRRYSNHY